MEESFFAKVYFVVRKIPAGKVATYRQIARLSGSPRAARAVGMAMKRNPDLERIPCHRVVGSYGSLTGYSAHGGVTQKKKMLQREGVIFIGPKVKLAEYLWDGG